MAKELNEDTGFVLSIKTLIGIGFGIATVVGMWFALQADIAEAKEEPVPVDVTIIKEEILKEIPEAEITRMEFDMKDQMIRQTIMTTQSDIADAKELPKPPAAEVTRMEFDMKDQMIRQTIMTTQEDVKEIKKTLEKIEDKLYNR